jgi:hypothetical protein
MEMRELLRHFHQNLFAAIRGSIQVYVAVTGPHPEQWRPKAWEEYNTAFEKEIVAALLEVLEKRNCGPGEVCHAALKLLDVAAMLSNEAEKADAEKGEPLRWFVPAPH